MPDSSPRSGAYTVGGLSPYGFSKTPPYNNKWVPDVGGDIGLYERMDYDTQIKGSAAQLSYSNPPFLATGMTTTPGRTPAWMQDDKHQVRRILRGYIRRDDPYQWSTGAVNVDNTDKASNARLYFMYNPSSVTRTYASLDQVSSYLNVKDDPSGISPPYIATADFELLFDRQQEVATLDNSPGCLVDLAVFDLLVGNGPSQGQQTRDSAPVSGQNGVPDRIGKPVGNDALAVPSTADNESSMTLTFDPAIILVVNISPNLAYRGSVTAAAATFEKFSHRMTPMRMTLQLSMRLYSVGQEPSIKYRTTSSADVASAQAAAKDADPTQSVASQEAADKVNKAGRELALSWARKWIGKVYYSQEHRCDNQKDDLLTNTDPPHVPTYFDCSSFVARSFAVAGLSQALELPACADTTVFAAVAKKYNDASHPWDIKHLAYGNPYDQISDFLEPGVVLLREKNPTGHAAFINQDLGGSGGGHKWEILHIGAPGQSVSVHTSTTQQILMGGSGFKPYNYLMKSQPAHYDKNVTVPNNPLAGPS